MYEYFCPDCDLPPELSCRVEVKKICPCCGLLMDHKETEG